MLSVKSFWLLSCLPLMLSVCCIADEAKDEAIKKDRKQIQGNWRIIGLEINGNKAKEEDARKLLVINGDDGTWKLMSEGKEVCQGTSTIDPTTKPKQLDFTIRKEKCVLLPRAKIALQSLSRQLAAKSSWFISNESCQALILKPFRTG